MEGSTSSEIRLNAGDDDRLHALADDADARMALRARIVLESARGSSAETVGEQLAVAPVTVYKWRARYRQGGIDGLRDLPRCGQPRKLSWDTVTTIARWTEERLPQDHVRWSVRTLARAAGVTEHQIRTIWAERGLRPHETPQQGPLADRSLGWAELDVVGLLIAPPFNLVVLGARSHATRCGRSDGHRRRWSSGRRMSEVRRGQETIFTAHDHAERSEEGDRAAADRAGELRAYLEGYTRAPEGVELHLLASCPRAASAAREATSLEPRWPVHAMPTVGTWASALESWMSSKESRMRWQGEFTRVLELRQALGEFVGATHPRCGRAFAWRAGSASVSLGAAGHHERAPHA